MNYEHTPAINAIAALEKMIDAFTDAHGFKPTHVDVTPEWHDWLVIELRLKRLLGDMRGHLTQVAGLRVNLVQSVNGLTAAPQLRVYAVRVRP